MFLFRIKRQARNVFPSDVEIVWDNESQLFIQSS